MANHPVHSEHSDPTAHAAHTPHIVPVWIYVTVWLSLMIGTVATWAIAYVDLKQWNIVVALLIACTKASLVILFFMHVFYSTKLVKTIVIAGLGTLMILFFFTTLDLAARGELFGSHPWIGVPGR
jgi:cytochrome c oxidase subunit 4